MIVFHATTVVMVNAATRKLAAVTTSFPVLNNAIDVNTIINSTTAEHLNSHPTETGNIISTD